MTRLLEMRKIEIEGFSSEEEKWMPIIKGLDVSLEKGGGLVLIGGGGGGEGVTAASPPSE